MINKQEILKRMIILCWGLLFVCFSIKLFGGNWFEIIVTNEKFIKLCTIVDNSIIAKYIIGCISSSITVSLFLLAICQKWYFTKPIEIILVIITVFGGVAIKLWNSYAGLAVDLWQFLLLPMILLGKPSIKWLNILIGNILNIIFQIVSVYVKDPQIKLLTNDVLIGMIMCIDLFIMLSLYYIYSNIKGEKMGIFFGWFFSTDTVQLEAYKATLTNEKTIAKVQSRIDKLKSQENKTE